MLKDEKKYLKEEFNRIINKVPASKEIELSDICTSQLNVDTLIT